MPHTSWYQFLKWSGDTLTKSLFAMVSARLPANIIEPLGTGSIYVFCYICTISRAESQKTTKIPSSDILKNGHKKCHSEILSLLYV